LLTPLPRDEGLRQPVVQFQPKPAPVAAPPPRDVAADILVALESQLVDANEAPSVPDVLALDEMQFPALDLDSMKERYPLLRNAL
jgi:hypothetical protein